MWHKGLPSPHNCGCVRGNAHIESSSAAQNGNDTTLQNNNQGSDLNLTLIHLNGTARGKTADASVKSKRGV